MLVRIEAVLVAALVAVTMVGFGDSGGGDGGSNGDRDCGDGEVLVLVPMAQIIVVVASVAQVDRLAIERRKKSGGGGSRR